MLVCFYERDAKETRAFEIARLHGECPTLFPCVTSLRHFFRSVDYIDSQALKDA
jgi:hypothetical protein